MRAVVMKEFGAPDVLRLAEVPDPPPGADEVVIDVELANVTFVETQVRAGRPPNPAMLPRCSRASNFPRPMRCGLRTCWAHHTRLRSRALRVGGPATIQGSTSTLRSA